MVKGAQYAKYYFIMRTLSDSIQKDGCKLSEFEDEKRNKKSTKEEWGQHALKNCISVEKMQGLQKNLARAELYLKEKH